MQVIVDASNDYSATSTDPLKNMRILRLNFETLANRFSTSGTATGDSWSIMNTALTAHLAGSNSMALGGDLAYQYGKGNIAQLTVAGAQSTLQSNTFGASAQGVTVGLTLSQGQVGLTV